MREFVVAAAETAARRALEEASTIRLSVEDQRRFVELLLNPPEPTPALEQARAAHEALIGPLRRIALSRSGFSARRIARNSAAAAEPLDRYFKTQARQDVRRRVSVCYVAVEKATGRIAGYYTLPAADIPVPDLPADSARRLPRYPSVPAAHIGRLAIDRRFRGRGLGGALLLNAAMRSLSSEIAVFALVVDAKDDEAATFYRHHGFVSFASNPLQLIAPIETFRKLLG